MCVFRLQLKDQSKLVVEENKLLMDQKILYKNTIDDLTNDYQKEGIIYVILKANHLLYK